jgi:hypothetical protein
MSFVQCQEFHRLFTKFAERVKRHQSIVTHSIIVVVPLLRDIGAPRVLPKPPFPPSVAALLPEAMLISNACQLGFLSRTMGVFRDALLKRLSNAAVLTVPERDADQNMLRKSKQATRHRMWQDFGISFLIMASNFASNLS